MHDLHHHTKPVGKKSLGLSIGLNLLISVSQGIGAFISGSYSLLSDALHNLTDVFSLVISFIAVKLGSKKNTLTRTFGFQRAEMMAAFFNSLTLILLAGFLMFEGIIRWKKEPVINFEWVIWLAVASILINAASVLILHKDAKRSINIKSSYLHLFTDMMTSIAVLIGGLLMKYFGWFWVDSLLTILIAVFLLIQSFSIFYRSLRSLLMFTPKGINIEKIAKEVESISGIKDIHHIHVWEMSDHTIILEAHIDLNADFRISQFEAILLEIEKLLHDNFDISHINIQPEISKPDSKQIIA
ncbi:MAG: cation transporter [Bacteroidales bacterium]|nr:cation transporter [Bacteroidales bacterium]